MFQDRNVEVLRDVTLPNAVANVGSEQCLKNASFVIGDWEVVEELLLSHISGKQYDVILSTETIYSVEYVHITLHNNERT